MSIVRIGLAETKNFAEGYDAIFGKKEEEKKEEAKEHKDSAKSKKKSNAKKK